MKSFKQKRKLSCLKSNNKNKIVLDKIKDKSILDKMRKEIIELIEQNENEVI